jgi:hypothetical protein
MGASLQKEIAALPDPANELKVRYVCAAVAFLQQIVSAV